MDSLPFWALIVAYAAHVMEEYFLDWRGWAESISKFKLTWKEFFVANSAVIILGLSCSVIGFSYPYFSFMFVGLALVNAVFAHIGATVVKRKFSPGLLTSVVLFLPICVWAYVEAAQRDILNPAFITMTLLGGCVIMMYPVLLQIVKVKLRKK